ncbi:MAG TPA: TonB family protein [Cyclobacteriaceae bacterium]|nr:TonB family protein [Cyclobacteriaceae bacterium]
MRWIVFGLVFQIHSSFAQEHHTQFYDKKGMETDSAHSFYYERWTYSEPDQNTVISYYTATNTVRFTGGKKGLSEHQARTYYYPNGRIKAEGHFSNRRPTGLVKSFYANGSPQAELVFEDHKMWDEKDPAVGILNYWDSVGNQIVADGHGECHCDLTPFSDFVEYENGIVINGLKEGKWDGKIENGESDYEELYQKGILIKGRQNDGNDIWEYLDLETDAMPRGGVKSFYQHVAAVIHYPEAARRKNIEGKVFVEFVVEIDGRLSHIKVIRGIDEECDKEALNAVTSAPRWDPAFKRGKPVRQRLTLPIIFKIR